MIVRQHVAVAVDHHSGAEASLISNPELQGHHCGQHPAGHPRHRTRWPLDRRLSLGQRGARIVQQCADLCGEPAHQPAHSADQQRHRSERGERQVAHPATEEHFRQA